ncbi:hypothetical protein C7330_3822 [Pectobacterium versatile]|nr:hypothetical protein C7330_3822 [Pectobacterium versatile]
MGLPYTEEWDDETAPWFHIVQDMLATADCSGQVILATVLQ